jgi:predicted phosphodiesterase
MSAEQRTPMKILVLSDLHTEYQEFEPVFSDGGKRIDADADVVVLAGDIGSGTEGIEWAARTFPDKPIVYVAGNHEFYDSTMESMLDDMREVAAALQVHFLEREAVEIGGIRFLGATLWSDFDIFGRDKRQMCINESIMCMNDFRLIHTTRPTPNHSPNAEPGARRFFPEDAMEVHQMSVAWLETELAQGDPARTVVVTHHAPHFNSVEPRYAYEPTTGAFASDLTRLMGRCSLWIHGHMHHTCSYTVNGTEVLANPRGYIRWDGSPENRQFEPGLLFEIPPGDTP